MRHFLPFILTACMACALHAQHNAVTKEQAAIIREISAASAKIVSMESDFVQTKYITMLNDKLVSKGKIRFQQPDKLLWEYTTPYTYSFIINNNKIKIRNNNRTDIIDSNHNKVFKEISRLMMMTVRGNSLTDDKVFDVTVKSEKKAQGKGQEYQAILVPKRKEMKQLWNRLVLHFDVANKILSTIEMFEKNGDHTIIEMQHVVLNKAIDSNVFNVD